MYYTQESECPDSFLWWTGITTISAAVQRRVYTHWLYWKYYPNIYTILIGPPGRVHKSSAIKFGKGLLNDVDVGVSSEAITKEALILQMKHGGTGGNEALAVFSSEFGSFIAPSGIRMVEFLTDIYDCDENWEYTTKGSGKATIPQPYLSLLAGTTPAWVAEEFSSAFIDTGFAARTIFVAERDPRFRKAFASVTTQMHQMRSALVSDLDAIANLEGEMAWTEDARGWFQHWYEKEFEDESIDYRLEGYLNRKPTHIVRLSMLLSLAESDELLLDARHMSQAKQLLDGLEPKMAQAFALVGRNALANDMDRITADIISAGGMTFGELLAKNSHSLTRTELNEVLDNIVSIGGIDRVNRDGQVHYRPTGRT